MFLKRMLLAVAVLLQALALSGYAADVQLNAANEQDKFAKTFSPPHGKALIYVYLAEPNLNISNRVVIDGRVTEMIRPSLFSMSNVMPGRHRVGLDHLGADSILLDAEQGKAYFLEARVSCEGGAARAQLQIVDASTGMRQISAPNFSSVTLFGDPLLNDLFGNPLLNDAGLTDNCRLSIGKL
jgi:hypothetical protein